MHESTANEEGAARRRRAQGAKADQLQAALTALDPKLGEWADGFVFGDVWGRPGLEFDQRMLVAITALAAGGYMPQLKNYLHGALEAGIPAQAVHEALLMLVVYCGMPAALGAMVCWSEVVASARRRGLDVDLPS